MSNNEYKKAKNKYLLYIIGVYVLGLVLIYFGWKNRVSVYKNEIVTSASMFNRQFIVGIACVVIGILSTLFLLWINKKVKSSHNTGANSDN